MDPQLTTQPNESEPARDDASKVDRLHKIIRLSNIKNVVPIISNSFYLDEVLASEEKITSLIPPNPEDIDEDLTVDEQLTKLWAKKIEYPMTDDHNLARVAQYYQVKSDSGDVAKEDYLRFLNSHILKINSEKQELQPVIRRLKADVQNLRFSEIIHQMGYPKLVAKPDPLDILAKVQFPIYITTSYHDFLERALINEKRTPKTQVVFLNRDYYEDAVENQHFPLSEIKPTATEPVVYHLFGLENYPGSLVISEDDYMKFLVSVVTDTDTQHPIVPFRLRRAISSSHLLMLGYHVRDWDFRVLFRFILEIRKGTKDAVERGGIFIQIPPKKEIRTLLDYLRGYVNQADFEIQWKRPKDFTQELWEVWEGQLSHDEQD